MRMRTRRRPHTPAPPSAGSLGPTPPAPPHGTSPPAAPPPPPPSAGLLGPTLRDPTHGKSPPAGPARPSAALLLLTQPVVGGARVTRRPLRAHPPSRLGLRERLQLRYVGTGSHPEPAAVDFG